MLYIARDKRSAALRFVERIEAHCRTQLTEFPLSCSARPDLGAGVRMSVIRPYLILYRPIRSGVRILRVVHGARRLTRRTAGSG